MYTPIRDPSVILHKLLRTSLAGISAHVVPFSWKENSPVDEPMDHGEVPWDYTQRVNTTKKGGYVNDRNERLGPMAHVFLSWIGEVMDAPSPVSFFDEPHQICFLFI